MLRGCGSGNAAVAASGCALLPPGEIERSAADAAAVLVAAQRHGRRERWFRSRHYRFPAMAHLLGVTRPVLMVAADCVLPRLPNPVEIARVRTADSYRVVDAITEAMRQDGVVHGHFAALSLGDRKVLVGRHAVAQAGRDRHEVARASELLRAEAFGHLAHELRDVSLLGCPDENSLGPERPQLGCRRSAALRIRLKPHYVPTLLALGPAALAPADMAAASPSVLFPGAAVPPTWTNRSIDFADVPVHR